ncbi:molybdopterin-guanine dinucleotide biosynthesis protein B [Chloroflexota bacterium]
MRNPDMHPIVSIIGRSNSGKTTLLESLIAEMKRRGIEVAVIKHAGEEFDIDTEGKDSWRFRRAGSETVVVSSPHQMAIMKEVSHDLSPQELSRKIDDDFALILTEGFKQANTYKIEVHRKEQGNDLVSNPKQLLAVVTDEPLSTNAPHFDRGEISKLADLIEQQVLAKHWGDEIELWVNDSFITMKPFVKEILRNIVTGFINSLKGVTKIKKIQINLRRKDGNLYGS